MFILVVWFSARLAKLEHCCTISQVKITCGMLINHIFQCYHGQKVNFSLHDTPFRLPTFNFFECFSPNVHFDGALLFFGHGTYGNNGEYSTSVQSTQQNAAHVQ